MTATDAEIEAIREVMKTRSTQTLEDERQVLHKRKLMDGLVVPGRREQLETLISLINDELKRREARDD